MSGREESLKELKEYIERKQLTTCDGCEDLLKDIKKNLKELKKKKCDMCIMFHVALLENYTIVAR